MAGESSDKKAGPVDPLIAEIVERDKALIRKFGADVFDDMDCRPGPAATGVSDFECDQCHAPAGLMVQGEAFTFRCSKCNAPGPASLLRLVADNLKSRYRAVLLSKDNEELSVIAEGIGAGIVPQVLHAAAAGAFVWMKPL
jgi:hypothetical protein